MLTQRMRSDGDLVRIELGEACLHGLQDSSRSPVCECVRQGVLMRMGVDD